MLSEVIKIDGAAEHPLKRQIQIMGQDLPAALPLHSHQQSPANDVDEIRVAGRPFDDLIRDVVFAGQSRTLRTYPPHLGAHMLGYLSEVNARKVEQDPYYKPGDVIGVGGLESYYEEDLRGKRGVKYVVVDVHNNVQGPFKGGQFDTLAYAGKNLYTSIDAKMQALGERLMRNKTVSYTHLTLPTSDLV